MMMIMYGKATKQCFYLGLGPTVRNSSRADFLKSIFLEKLIKLNLHGSFGLRSSTRDEKKENLIYRRGAGQHLKSTCIAWTTPTPSQRPKHPPTWGESIWFLLPYCHIAIMPYCHIAIMLIKQLITKTSGYIGLHLRQKTVQRGVDKSCAR